jgi:hypothetical protein
LEPCGHLDVAQSSFEGSDAFVALGNALPFCQDASFALAHVLGILLSTAMDGGDEAVGCSSDGLVDVVLLEENVLGGFSG